MDALASLIDQFGDDPVLTIGVLVVFGTGLALFFAVTLLRERNEVRRRAASEADAAASTQSAPQRSLERLVAFLDANLSGEAGRNRPLQRQLIQAGFFDRRAIAIYFAARLAGAI